MKYGKKDLDSYTNKGSNKVIRSFASLLIVEKVLFKVLGVLSKKFYKLGILCSKRWHI
ncbi:hypothetical protein HanRHA438_Chr16g0746131 [Helianthus annuus]|uniref:Uncharacterized protein n=1 Tax=Helianthus annuus TaxID=4232 RepID=A0A251RXJ5_HELAN|nr:hypothetical protein HanXRQr2_Chr16g0733731 [Helianthus annuus]KAJ0834656.1 hypothetical protein HanRHA438_Chr16g0746131 [Helianthus annuus]